MSLPTASDLLGLDYSFCGEPFCIASAHPNIWMSEMDISFAGEPFGWLIGGTYLPLAEADITYLGEPFVWVCVPLIDTSGMDYSYVGEPYVVNYGWGGVTTYIKVIRVSWSAVNKFLGVNSTNVSKIVGIEP